MKNGSVIEFLCIYGAGYDRYAEAIADGNIGKHSELCGS